MPRKSSCKNVAWYANNCFCFVLKLHLEIADDAAKSEFLREIETMKGIGYHGNLCKIEDSVLNNVEFQ